MDGSGVDVEVDVVEELGADAYLYGRISAPGSTTGYSLVARADGRDPPRRDTRVRLRPRSGHVYFFGADGRRIG
jgi:multiple sugar transport system ATP-binding protein